MCGQAGTGKTTAARHAVNLIRGTDAREHEKVLIAAASANAAKALRGKTLHRLLGSRPQDLRPPVHMIVQTIARSKRAVVERFKHASTLVVDEVSNVPPKILEIVDHVARFARERPRESFGGLKVIALGDFYQQAPITADDEDECLDEGVPRYVFETATWRDAGFVGVELGLVHRQGDVEFADFLRMVRRGGYDERVDAFVERNLAVQSGETVDIAFTRIFARRDAVDEWNDRVISRLFRDDAILRWNAVHEDGSRATSPKCEFPAELRLARGVKVCLTRNPMHIRGLPTGTPRDDVDRDVVNGAEGEVVGFASFADAKTTSKIPWLAFRDAPPDMFGGNLPIVRFEVCDGSSFDAIVCPTRYERDSGPAAFQIPLKAVFAMTVHRAQGMTLRKVLVDVAGMVRHAQVYVALSRVRDRGDMRVVNWRQVQIVVDPRVSEMW